MTLQNSLSKSNKDSATYIGVAPNSLKQSRITGILCGVEAPKYMKMGKIVRYRIETLDQWLSQFEEISNTAN